MEIKLTKGLSVLVDADDYEFLNQWKWYALRPTGNNNNYAARGVYDKVTKKRTTLYMHKLLLDTKDYVDHRNRNTLDNRRSNLRNATPSQSRGNGTPKGVSKYMGVSWSKGSSKWQATISYGGRKRHLGLFDNEKDAALMYNSWAKEVHREFANLNVVD